MWYCALMFCQLRLQIRPCCNLCVYGWYICTTPVNIIENDTEYKIFCWFSLSPVPFRIIFLDPYPFVIMQIAIHLIRLNEYTTGAGQKRAPCDGNPRMTSSNENIFRDYRWIPFTKASDADLWCFLWSAAKQTVEQTFETQVIWDAITPFMTSL